VRRDARTDSALGADIARLVAARESPERERALLDSVARRSGCAAVELWGRDALGWRALRGSGDPQRMIPAERVRAALEGRLALDVLPPGEEIVAVDDWALALSAPEARDAADEIEALLLVLDALARAAPGDIQPPPLPSRDEPRSAPPS
jgi:hypothetical protein